MEILTLRKRDIHNVKLKGDNFKIRFKMILGKTFNIIKSQGYDNIKDNGQPNKYDNPIKESVITTMKDIFLLAGHLDLNFIGEKKLFNWSEKSMGINAWDQLRK